MNKKIVQNIERNRLDYILTDLLPLEVSEVMDFYAFYEFLLGKRAEIDKLIKTLRKIVSGGQGNPLKDALPSVPLKYDILKGTNGRRTINLLHPMAMLNVYLFFELYQKQILIMLKSNSCYSLRYHRKNTRLYYQLRMGRFHHYFQRNITETPIPSIGGIGEYFDVFPYKSVTAFTTSFEWKKLKRSYSYFMHLDYKSCFPSIYTHAYKWTRTFDTIDSKELNNSNIYVAIDNLLQKINARSSNGVVVGPEFSRMVVEILLQNIDVAVKATLLLKGLVNDTHYVIRRYVDDIYVFANSEKDLDIIKCSVEDEAAKYLLQLNENKIEICKTSDMSKKWISKVRRLSDVLSTCFLKERELKNAEDTNATLISCNRSSVRRLMDDFDVLLQEIGDSSRSAVSYMLSTLHNKVLSRGKGVILIRSRFFSSAFALLEFAFYLWSKSPCYEHTNRLISILNYMNDDIRFSESHELYSRLSRILCLYENVILEAELADCMNLILVLPEFGVTFSSGVEDRLFERIKASDNPVYLADFIMYCRIHPDYQLHVISYLNDILKEKIKGLDHKESMVLPNFWYLLIFVNCPHLTDENKNAAVSVCQGHLSVIASSNQNKNDLNIRSITKKLLYEYLMRGGFYRWNVSFSQVKRRVTYKTWHRSMYRAKHVRTHSEVEASII